MIFAVTEKGEKMVARYIDADELAKRVKVSPIFATDGENADEDF